MAQSTVDDFRAAVVDATLTDDKLAELEFDEAQRVNSAAVAHELSWRTEDVLRAAAVLDLLLAIQRCVRGDASNEVKLERLSNDLEQHVDHLTGGHWGCTEPWRANSTSALSNLDNIAKCSARQVAIKVLKPIIKALREVVILDPNEDR